MAFGDRRDTVNWKMPKLFYMVSLPVIFVFFFIGLVNDLNPQATSDYRGIAADSQGNVYIGQKHDILKLSPEGEQLAVIYAGTGRGWGFTVIDDRLLIEYGDGYALMDTDGVLLKTISLEEMSTVEFPYETILHQHSFTAADGTKYVQKGFPRITFCRIQNGEETVIYQMPVYAAVCRIILMICVISLLICIPIIIYQSIKLNT